MISSKFVYHISGLDHIPFKCRPNISAASVYIKREDTVVPCMSSEDHHAPGVDYGDQHMADRITTLTG